MTAPSPTVPPSGGAATPALELRAVRKRFGAVAALDDASLVVAPSSVHALLGENGAGKTTLMRIAFGMLAADGGELRVDGTARRFRAPADAIAAGLGMVHQHFTLVPTMTVAENVALAGGLRDDASDVAGARRSGAAWRLDPRASAERLTRLAAEIGLPVDPAARVESLPVAAQQRVEILKAVSRGARTLILDEPTAVLAPRETEELLAWLRGYAARGHAVVLITHKLREALALADDVTVLRLGRTVLAAPARGLGLGGLTTAMVGAEGAREGSDRIALGLAGVGPSDAAADPALGPPSPAASSEPLAGPPPDRTIAPSGVEGVIAAMRRGASRGDDSLDAVGPPPDHTIAPREGSAVTPTPRPTSPDRALAGAGVASSSGPRSAAPVVEARALALRDERGQAAIGDATFVIAGGEIVGVAAVEGAGQHALLRALAGRIAPSGGTLTLPATIGFIPEDRHRDALALDFTLAENVALRDAGARRGGVPWRAIRERTASLLAAFDVRAPGALTAARALSGGNQQKLVLARELADAPALVVAENPTRGLDVHATAAVLARLREAAAAGAAVVLYSSDLDEVLALATRVLVVHAGAVLETPLDREAVGRAMLGA